MRLHRADPGRRPALRALTAALLLTLASGCVYRMNIQQGNFLEKRAYDQLQVGMTRSQVRYLMGTPMVPSTFDNDRWDYLYYIKRGRIEKPVQRQLTVYFQNDKVSRIMSQGNLNSEPVPIEAPIRPIT